MQLLLDGRGVLPPRADVPPNRSLVPVMNDPARLRATSDWANVEPFERITVGCGYSLGSAGCRVFPHGAFIGDGMTRMWTANRPPLALPAVCDWRLRDGRACDVSQVEMMPEPDGHRPTYRDLGPFPERAGLRSFER